MADDKEIKYLKMAFDLAQSRGTDPSTQNGAVIISNRNYTLGPDWILGEGANHFPVGVEENEKRWERPLKYQFVEHAERNAIFEAARNGDATRGSTMYCCWYACADCARAIIQAGIKEIIGHQKCFDLTPDHWRDSIQVAFQMFKEAKVTTRNITETMGATIRFNGQYIDF